MQLSRDYLGKCIQFFSGHGWWKKHLRIAQLCRDNECRLCCEEGAIKCPIHFFSECPALADVRCELFNDSLPTQLMGQQYLCHVVELILHGSLLDLMVSKMVNYGGNGLFGCPWRSHLWQFNCLSQELRTWKTK